MQLVLNAANVAALVLASTIPTGTGPTLDPHQPAVHPQPGTSSARPGVDVRQVPMFEALARLLESQLRTESLAAALLRTDLRRAAAMSPPPQPWDAFMAYLEGNAAYHVLYEEFIFQEALEVAHAQLPHFEQSEAARAEVFGAFGEGYQLTQSWLAAPSPNGTTFPVLLTNGSGSELLEDLLMYDYSLPEADFSGAPDCVAADLDPFNDDPLNGWFYSAEVAGVAHTGMASPFLAGGVLHLAIWPDTVTDSSSLFSAPTIAYARYLDHGAGLDWVGLLQFFRPAFDQPTWDPGTSGGGSYQGGGCQTVEECLAQAAAEYETAVAAAMAAASAAIDMAEADYEADAEANAQSQQGFFDCFSRAGWNGPIAGGTYEEYSEYVSNFDAENEAEYEEDIANARANLNNAICAAIATARDKMKNCILDCPEWEGLGPYIDAWADAESQKCQ